MATTGSSAAPADRQWFIASRWQEYAGESRANLLRLIGIASFYTVELVNYYWLGGVERPFHIQVTALAITWSMLALGVYWCLQLRIFPEWLKFLTSGIDVLLLTSVLTLADGPKSPLVVGYFALLALATLRLSLSLIWFTSGACLAGYVFLLGHAKWFAENTRVPQHYQLIFIVALVLTGVVLGQVIRRVRQLADDFALRLRAAEQQPS